MFKCMWLIHLRQLYFYVMMKKLNVLIHENQHVSRKCPFTLHKHSSTDSCSGVRGHGQASEQVEVQHLTAWTDTRWDVFYQPGSLRYVCKLTNEPSQPTYCPSTARIPTRCTWLECLCLGSILARGSAAGLLAPPSPWNSPAARPSVTHPCETESEKLCSYGDQGPGFILDQLLQLHAGIWEIILLIEVYLSLFLKLKIHLFF